jgi:hypothetical protein
VDSDRFGCSNVGATGGCYSAQNNNSDDLRGWLHDLYAFALDSDDSKGLSTRATVLISVGWIYKFTQTNKANKSVFLCAREKTRDVRKLQISNKQILVDFSMTGQSKGMKKYKKELLLQAVSKGKPKTHKKYQLLMSST